MLYVGVIQVMYGNEDWWQHLYACGSWQHCGQSINEIHYGCIKVMLLWSLTINTLRLRQNGRYLPDDIFEFIFLNEKVWISSMISLKFVSKGPINNIPALVQIMAWRRSGYKPLSEPIMVSLLMHICATRPQCVKRRCNFLTDLIPGILTSQRVVICESGLILWELF